MRPLSSWSPHPPTHLLRFLWFHRQCLLTVSPVVSLQITSGSLLIHIILLNKNHLLAIEIAALIQVPRPTECVWSLFCLLRAAHSQTHSSASLWAGSDKAQGESATRGSRHTSSWCLGLQCWHVGHYQPSPDALRTASEREETSPLSEAVGRYRAEPLRHFALGHCFKKSPGSSFQMRQLWRL